MFAVFLGGLEEALGAVLPEDMVVDGQESRVDPASACYPYPDLEVSSELKQSIY